ncbi:MAG: double-strand break repair protein AddB, partial [Alphaproteobacteria bacterium]|nr:double-strand break repair protein AddB [Alphaproteobacteria bacterium]
MKNVFTIEPNAAFLDTLAEELWRRADGDGLQLSQNLVLLPTRRACRYLGASFARLAGDRPVLLPRLRPLGDSDEDEMAFADDTIIDLPPAIAPLKRLMLLTQQVQKRDPAMSCDQAAQAAEALAKFLDQIQIERCDIGKLPTLVAKADLAQHWQQTLHFLDIVTRFWPAIVREQGCIDPQERRNTVLTAQAAIWRQTPPPYPVIAAGSTGSVPATAELLDVIAAMPQGAVILPGLDRAMDNLSWDEITDTHPQHGLKKLLEKIGVDRADVRDFGAPTPASARAQLIRESMRPAKTAQGWRELRGILTGECARGLTRLTLDHPQEEAQVIALRLRAFLETPDKTAAFITADRGLAMRVAALL